MSDAVWTFFLRLVPSGVIATPTGLLPTVMSVGFLVRVATSIVDTDPETALVTKAVPQLVLVPAASTSRESAPGTYQFGYWLLSSSEPERPTGSRSPVPTWVTDYRECVASRAGECVNTGVHYQLEQVTPGRA